MRYFLELSYHGKNYHGWQRQPNAISVQEVLEKALSTLLRKSISIIGAGRTDAGVHAKVMVAHFDTVLTSIQEEQLVYHLNQFLSSDIAIHSLKKVNPGAHARFDAISRSYEYYITSEKTAFNNDLHFLFKNPLDIDAMNNAANCLLDYEDFECFSKANTDVKTFLCKIEKAEWIKSENGYIFTITANRFLRNMVRAIVGTLLNVGEDKINTKQFLMILESKDRSKAGFSAPAHALFLTKITYPKSVYI